MKIVKEQRGIGLIEVIIAVALLGLVIVALLSALATAARSTYIADERATAESIARTQMEDIKEQPYSDAEVGDVGEYEKIDASQIPEGYSIMSLNRLDQPIEEIVGIPWNLSDALGPVGPVPNDDGLQLIRLIIKHHDKEVITLEGVKVNR